MRKLFEFVRDNLYGAIAFALVTGVIGNFIYDRLKGSEPTSSTGSEPWVISPHNVGGARPLISSEATTFDRERSNLPAFDCSLAQVLAEKMICADSELGRLDSKMSRLYGRVWNTSNDRSLLRKLQREWLEKTRNACETKDCLIKVYEEKIKHLETALASR